MGGINTFQASVRCVTTNITRGNQANGRFLDMGKWRVQPRACCCSNRIWTQPALKEMARHEQKQRRPHQARATSCGSTNAKNCHVLGRFWIFSLAVSQGIEGRRAAYSRRRVRHRVLDFLGVTSFCAHSHRPFWECRNQAITNTPAVPLDQRDSTSQPLRVQPPKQCTQRCTIAQAAPSTRKLSALTIRNLLSGLSDGMHRSTQVSPVHVRA